MILRACVEITDERRFNFQNEMPPWSKANQIAKAVPPTFEIELTIIR